VHLLLLAAVCSRAQQDLDRAKHQHKPTEPIPVVLNVSNRDAREGTFDQWWLNEVARRHSKDVDRDALRQLLERGGPEVVGRFGVVRASGG
jgi:hypothetical protein